MTHTDPDARPITSPCGHVLCESFNVCLFTGTPEAVAAATGRDA